MTNQVRNMIQQIETGEASPGSILIHLAHRKAKDSLLVQRKLFVYEKQLLDASFEADQDSPVFRENYATALRLALSSENNELFDLLLERNVSRDAFKNEPDILQIAIYASRMAYKYKLEPEDFKKRITTLIDHGASINTFDEKERSPLYYTCIYGCPETFKLLVELGADFSALFKSHSSGDIRTQVNELGTPESDSDEYDGVGEKKNLLQITLNAQESERGNYTSHMWGSMGDSVKTRHKMWVPIVTYLLDAGLSCPPDYPSLISLLHASCYLGNLPFVEKLLDSGVDQTARAGPRKVRNHGLIFGSALHIAAAMGQKSIALCLLQHGADPRAKYLCKRWQVKVFSTPAQLALNGVPTLHAGSITPEVLDVCNILFDRGSDRQDGQLLLEACIKAGDRERCTALLAQGFSIPENLICSDLEVAKLLLNHGYQFDGAKMQKNAIQGAHMDLMRFLVERYGPMLPLDDIEPTVSHAIAINRKEVLRYLVTEFGFDINSTFPCRPDNLCHQLTPNERTNLIQVACDGNNGYAVEAVKLLLELGADPNCPPLLVRLHKQIQFFAPRQFFMISCYIRLIRLLLQYSSEDLSEWTIISAAKVPEVKPRTQQTVNMPSVSRGNEDGHVAMEASEKSVQTPEQKGKQLEPVSRATGQSTFTAGQTLPKDEPERFVYPSLPSFIQRIRVLQLEPSKSVDGPVRGHIVLMNWLQKSHYDALSYDDQGDGSIMEGILINNSVVKISQNLWLALRRLRYEDKPRFIWVNELCLDQGNLKERNQYVDIMREIYQMANQVLLWTGEEEEDSHLIFEHLIEMEKYTERQKIDRMNAGDYPECDKKTQDAILKLCQRPCFFRSWIVPEISFAKDAIIMCGRYTKKFELLLNINYRAGSSLREWGSDLLAAEYYSKRGANHVNHYDTLKSIRETPRLRSLEILREIMVYSRFCDSKDPRDHIYSLLALMDQPIMTADYSRSVADIFSAFTRKVMEKLGGISILHWMGTSQRRKDLASWVQDFSISKPQGVLPGVYGITPPNMFRFNGLPDTHPQPSFHFRGISDFVVQGKYIESIQAIGPELVASADNKPGSINFIETMCAWESLAAELAEKKRFNSFLIYAFSETITTSNTCAGGDIHNAIPMQLDAFIAWYRNYGTNIIRNADADCVQEIAFIQSWCGPQSQEEHRNLASSFARQMEIACYGRCFFITSENSMGLAPPMAKAGDELVFCPGALYPFVVRKREGDGSYELIGDCFLYDFDLNKLFDDESQEVKEFVLR